MAALHTLHRARQWLGVLACDGTGRSTAVIAPLALIPILPEIPLLAALRCTDRRNERSERGHSDTGSRVRPETPRPYQRPWTDGGETSGADGFGGGDGYIRELRNYKSYQQERLLDF